MSRGRVITGTIVTLLILVLAACGGDQPTLESPPTGTATSTATIDPAAQPAVDAYVKFIETVNQAKMYPVMNDLPPEADFTPYTFDPTKNDYLAYITKLASRSTAWQGTPPQSRMQVESVDLEATPYPTVTLSDCYLISPDWRTYDVRNGEVLPKPSLAIPPPYLDTITMIEAEGHWGVRYIETDESATCTR